MSSTLTNEMKKVPDFPRYGQQCSNYLARLQDFFSDHPDSPTSLLCFVLFTGYLLSRGSNTSFLLCFKIISHQFPIYLSELLRLYTPSRQLRSSADTQVFRIPSSRTKSCGQRSFFYQAPVILNQLPVSVRYSISVSSFKSSLKPFSS